MNPPVRSVAVRDFQSIQDMEVELGGFTVLVGPSNSGKSAFLRAVRACLRNSFVPANVRIGATKSVITVDLADAEPVTIERGKSLSTYALGSQKYTKANRTVPEPVLKAIGMPTVEGSDLNFAFQFDRPFLLASTGTEAARVIGSLTNVILLHEAVREANRRRSDASQRLKIRQADVARYGEQAKEFVDLPEEKARLTVATDLLSKIEQQENDLARLRSIVATARDRQEQLDALVVPPEPPDLGLEQVASEFAQLQSLRSLVTRAQQHHWEIRQQVSQAQALQSQAERHEAEYQRVLHEMGVCPTCGKATA